MLSISSIKDKISENEDFLIAPCNPVAIEIQDSFRIVYHICRDFCDVMKKGILITLFAFLLVASYGQVKVNGKLSGRISGKIIDSTTNLPLEYATITLYTAGKIKPLTGTTSDSTGNFTIAKIPRGIYNIVIEFVGFRTINLNDIIVDQGHEVIDLHRIFTNKKSTVLQSVVVTTPGNLVENKIDKLVYNAEKDITSQTGVATDILKKVPQVSVDVDGNVELEGSTDIRFLINGKPSTIFGSNIADVLNPFRRTR